MSVCVECGAKATGKYSGPCTRCGNATCPRHSYFYVSESNIAITKNAPPMCWLHRDREPGVLGFDNLLSSGDNPNREAARARFMVVRTDRGPRISAVSTDPERTGSES